MPTIRKTIIVLADSWKIGGKCLAGKELLMDGNLITQVGPWIRPISAAHILEAGKSHGGQVTDIEVQRALGRDYGPKMLEIIDMSFIGPCATPDQPENWTLDLSVKWTSRGILEWKHADIVVDSPEAIWDSSGHGWNRVDAGYENRPGYQSLYCIRTSCLAVAEIESRPKTKDSPDIKLFKVIKLPHGRLIHELSISDPIFEAKYKSQYPALGAPAKTFPIAAGALITVSLTPAFSYTGKPPFYHYKMAAAIMESKSE